METAVKVRKKQPRKKKAAEQRVATISLPALAEEHMDVSTLETWLWDAACAVRGAADAPKFKDFILPLVFFKRLSDVFDDEFVAQVNEFGDEEVAREVIQADHEDALRNNRKPIVRFFIPHEYRWDAIRNHAADGTLGQFVTDAMRGVAKQIPICSVFSTSKITTSGRADNEHSTTTALLRSLRSSVVIASD